MKNNIKNIFKSLIVVTISLSLFSYISYYPIFDTSNEYQIVSAIQDPDMYYCDGEMRTCPCGADMC